MADEVDLGDPGSDDQDGATRAFGDMAAELAVLRRAVEAFQGKLEGVKARDYDATLGSIRDALEETSQRLDSMAAAPAMRLTPDQWTRQMQAAGEAGRREVQGQLEGARREVAAAAAELKGLVTQAATVEQQLRWQVFWGGLGVLAGVLVCIAVVMAIGATPARWAWREKLAGAVMREDRWSAGQDIARSANPQAWGEITAGAELEKANRQALDACRRSVARTGKAQRCCIQIEPATDSYSDAH